MGCGGEGGPGVTIFDGNVDDLTGSRNRDHTLTSRSHNHSFDQRRTEEPPGECEPCERDNHVLKQPVRRPDTRRAGRIQQRKHPGSPTPRLLDEHCVEWIGLVRKIIGGLQWMRKVCEQRVRGVEVGRIEDGVKSPNGQHKAYGTKGNSYWVQGYRGHGGRWKKEARGDDVAGPSRLRKPAGTTCPFNWAPICNSLSRSSPTG